MICYINVSQLCTWMERVCRTAVTNNSNKVLCSVVKDSHNTPIVFAVLLLLAVTSAYPKPSHPAHGCVFVDK